MAETTQYDLIKQHGAARTAQLGMLPYQMSLSDFPSVASFKINIDGNVSEHYIWRVGDVFAFDTSGGAAMASCKTAKTLDAALGHAASHWGEYWRWSSVERYEQVGG